MLFIYYIIADKGQALIIAYMLTGIIEGPMEQFSYNAQVFALSSVCGQDKLLKAKEETVQAAKQPIIGQLTVYSSINTLEKTLFTF